MRLGSRGITAISNRAGAGKTTLRGNTSKLLKAVRPSIMHYYNDNFYYIRSPRSGIHFMTIHSSYVHERRNYSSKSTAYAPNKTTWTGCDVTNSIRTVDPC